MESSTQFRGKKTNNRAPVEASVSRDVREALASVAARVDRIRQTRPTARLEESKSERTRHTVTRILRAAREIFIRDGHAGLSLRKVAAEAGIAVGNLTYHFATKNALLDAMLTEALADYVEAHLKHFDTDGAAPMEILLDVVEFYARDARTTHGFFFQLWGFAGSSPEARETVRGLYRQIGSFVLYLVRAANPVLDDQQARRALLQIFALEEGYKLFIGISPASAEEINFIEHDIRSLTRRIVETA